MRKSTLAQQLAVVAGFSNPQARLEQYPTPPEIAAHLIHVASLQGDLADRPVIDLGTGTGMLALGAALSDPAAVLGIDIDPEALATARANRDRVGTRTPVTWVRGDVTQPPIANRAKGTGPWAKRPIVVMNPPFGARNGNRHADRDFLATASEIAGVSYSIHNDGSREFVSAFAEDAGGTVTRGFRAEFSLPRQFEFHGEQRKELDVEVFRIEWE